MKQSIALQGNQSPALRLGHVAKRVTNLIGRVALPAAVISAKFSDERLANVSKNADICNAKLHERIIATGRASVIARTYHRAIFIAILILPYGCHIQQILLDGAMLV